MEGQIIKGIGLLNQTKNVKENIYNKLMKNSVCMLDSTYQLNGVGINAV